MRGELTRESRDKGVSPLKEKKKKGHYTAGGKKGNTG